MEKIALYFENIPSLHRSLILAGGIFIFWLLENAIPLFRFTYHKWKHAGINFFFTATSIVINFLLAFLMVKTTEWVSEYSIGILQWLPEMPLWLTMIIGLLLLDLIGAYTIHWMEHKVKWMWMFHLIHHTDPHVDTTTANRHHPGESVFRFVFTSLAIAIAGTPFWIVMLYQSLSVILSQFNHANISLPSKWDKMISLIIVTPNMHHTHHHYILPHTDYNYGNIFSIWDHIFKTFGRMNPEQVVYGVDTYQKDNEKSDINTLLKLPFLPYRPPVGAKFEENNSEA